VWLGLLLRVTAALAALWLLFVVFGIPELAGEADVTGVRMAATVAALIGMAVNRFIQRRRQKPVTWYGRTFAASLGAFLALSTTSVPNSVVEARQPALPMALAIGLLPTLVLVVIRGTTGWNRQRSGSTSSTGSGT
jgi:hypothetical protein